MDCFFHFHLPIRKRSKNSIDGKPNDILLSVNKVWLVSVVISINKGVKKYCHGSILLYEQFLKMLRSWCFTDCSCTTTAYLCNQTINNKLKFSVFIFNKNFRIKSAKQTHATPTNFHFSPASFQIIQAFSMAAAHQSELPSNTDGRSPFVDLLMPMSVWGTWQQFNFRTVAECSFFSPNETNNAIDSLS